MKTRLCVAIVVGLLSASVAAQGTVAGDWVLTIEDQFGPNVMCLSLNVTGEKLTGTGTSAIRWRRMPSS